MADAPALTCPRCGSLVALCREAAANGTVTETATCPRRSCGYAWINDLIEPPPPSRARRVSGRGARKERVDGGP